MKQIAVFLFALLLSAPALAQEGKAVGPNPPCLVLGTASGQCAQGGVVSAGGPTGSATVAPIVTFNAAGQLTAVSSATIAPAIGSVTGLGSGVAAALGINVGSAGAPVVLNGALGTPSSGVGTNLTGTAAGLTAGNVTTIPNLSGDVASVGNVTSYFNVVPEAKGGAGYGAVGVPSGSTINFDSKSQVTFSCVSACSINSVTNVVVNKLYTLCVTAAATGNVTITRDIAYTLTKTDITSIAVTATYDRACALFVGSTGSIVQLTAFASAG